MSWPLLLTSNACGTMLLVAEVFRAKTDCGASGVAAAKRRPFSKKRNSGLEKRHVLYWLERYVSSRDIPMTLKLFTKCEEVASECSQLRDIPLPFTRNSQGGGLATANARRGTAQTDMVSPGAYRQVEALTFANFI